MSETAQIIDVLKRTPKNRGLTYRDLARRVGLSEGSIKRVFSAETLVKLDNAGLIKLQPRLKARLRVGPVVSYRIDGPVHRVYERQVKAEILQAEFHGTDQVLHFRSAELSDASTRVLVRKIEQLARDFAELATLDVGLAAAEKKNVALLAAFRPWVSSMFQEIKPKAS